MSSLIVEKVVVEHGKPNVTHYAVATSARNRFSVLWSLTYEAHLTPWNTNREAVEDLQRTIENEVTP